MPDDERPFAHAGSGPVRAASVSLAPDRAASAAAPGRAAMPYVNDLAEGPRHAAAGPRVIQGGPRFLMFCAIGTAIFLLGLVIQAVLTGLWHVPPVASFFIQGVISVEMNFLLNRWLTWRDRDTPFWPAFARFNAQRTLTIALNLVSYAILVRLGMNYLVANVVLTVAFTAVNYLAGDRFVFVRSGQPGTPSLV